MIVGCKEVGLEYLEPIIMNKDCKRWKKKARMGNMSRASCQRVTGKNRAMLNEGVEGSIDKEDMKRGKLMLVMDSSIVSNLQGLCGGKHASINFVEASQSH